jgi:hypothetical protein
MVAGAADKWSEVVSDLENLRDRQHRARLKQPVVCKSARVFDPASAPIRRVGYWLLVLGIEVGQFSPPIYNREAGRENDAVNVENELRYWLQLADENFPIARHLAGV